MTKRQLDPIAFSGDGEHLLAGDGSAALYVIDVATGGVRKITGAPQSLSTARISRDGTMVLATIGCEEPLPPRPLLETIRVADGAANVISDENAPCRGSWNA